MSPYPNIEHFNIPSVIDNIHNLRELWVEAPVQKSSKPNDSPTEAQMGPNMPKPSISTDLGREMAGDLPLKLRAVTFSGTDFNRIADNVFNVNYLKILRFTRKASLFLFKYPLRELNRLLWKSLSTTPR